MKGGETDASRKEGRRDQMADEGRCGMRRMTLIMMAAGLLVGMVAGLAVATPPFGVTVTPLAPVAQFDEINAKAKAGDWESKIKTKGLSDLHVVEVTIQPGGTLGWHSHLGPSFVIVKSGTATFYEGDDPTCTPHVIPTGSSLFEPADDVHIVRNEGDVPLVNVVVQLLPTGAPRLISEPSPGNCPF
jgi:quercetin dioxygenase-like cupin family protein